MPRASAVGVLVGRTDLSTNPFSKAIIDSLNSLSDTNGEGMLLDDKGTILYSSSSEWVMEKYTGQTSREGKFFEGVTPDGTRSMMYYQPVRGQFLGCGDSGTSPGSSTAGLANCRAIDGHDHHPVFDRCPGVAFFFAHGHRLITEPGTGDQSHLQRSIG